MMRYLCAGGDGTKMYMCMVTKTRIVVNAIYGTFANSTYYPPEISAPFIKKCAIRYARIKYYM